MFSGTPNDHRLRNLLHEGDDRHAGQQLDEERIDNEQDRNAAAVIHDDKGDDLFHSSAADSRDHRSHQGGDADGRDCHDVLDDLQHDVAALIDEGCKDLRLLTQTQQGHAEEEGEDDDLQHIGRCHRVDDVIWHP